tara:strand:- start:5356 stop:7482 length:2127 start_codon:yes stop_codon:yes gene_type:complete
MTQQTSNIPEYFQPYLERLFDRAEGVTTEPFQRYEGQRLATTSPQQQAAYQGVEEMVGGYKPYIATADLLTAQAAQQSTDPTAITARMSPYQQSVIDIQKREALRDANKLQQQIGASAVGAGAFGGSRQALAETELGRQTGQRLADIQAVGSQQAYQQAMNQLSADRAASLAAGQQFAGLGAQQQQLGLAGLGALETVGGTQQAQQQRALDIGYEDFARETTYPQQQVQEMSSVLRGFNLPVSTYTTSQAQQAPPTFGQQAAGLGLGALGIYGAGKGVGLFAEGGDVPDNPGLKKLASKAPQVVEKMGFDPQEVINAYVGGKMTYAEGDLVSDPFTEGGMNYLISTFGPLEKARYEGALKEGLSKDEAIEFAKDASGKADPSYPEMFLPFIGPTARTLGSAKTIYDKAIQSPATQGTRKEPPKKTISQRISEATGGTKEIQPKASPQQRAEAVIPARIRGPKDAAQFGTGRFQQAKTLEAPINLEAQKKTTMMDTEEAMKKSQMDQKNSTDKNEPIIDPNKIIAGKEESSLDMLKNMLKPKEEGIDIMGAKTGLLDFIAAEDIRTGKAGAEEAAKRITERGLAQQKFKADEQQEQFNNAVAIAGLDLKQQELVANEAASIRKYISDTLKLDADRTNKYMAEILGNPMLVDLLQDPETKTKIIRQILDTEQELKKGIGDEKDSTDKAKLGTTDSGVAFTIKGIPNLKKE